MAIGNSFGTATAHCYHGCSQADVEYEVMLKQPDGDNFLLLKPGRQKMVDISILQTVLIGIGALIAWLQLRRMNLQAKADFTYRVYDDLLKWLSNHKECRKWIFSLDTLLKPNFDKWEFDDYLGYFETIWSLKKKRLVDKEIVYDILSDYLISVYEANDFELKRIIDKVRDDEGKDFYEGVENLYKEMKQYESKKGIVKRIHADLAKKSASNRASE